MIEWQRGWKPLDEECLRQYLERELGWELSNNPQHVLAERRFEAIGWRGSYDDLILRLDSRDDFAWVYLAWNSENQPTWPLTELIGGLASLNEFLKTWDRSRMWQSGTPEPTVLRAAVRLACQPNAGRINIGRQQVLHLPREWVLEHLDEVAAEALDLADYWEFRRLLELADLLQAPDLVQRFVAIGLESIDPDVREAAEDFRDQ